MTAQQIAADALRRAMDAELSTRARIGYVALLLAASAMTAVVFSLWLTEPVQPVRLQASFAVMTAIGAAWMVFAGWVLTTRKVLLGRQSVIAGRMAVCFTAVFTVGSLAVAAFAAQPAAYFAAATGLLMLTAAIVMLMRAQQRVARLNERRATLERALTRSAR